MSPPRTLRVYLVEHADGKRTGLLVRRYSSLFDGPPPSAYGTDEASVLRQLEIELRLRLSRDPGELDRYLWSERFDTRTVALRISPASVVDKQPVIGKREMPIRLTYAWCKGDDGSFRVMLPRFDWWLVLEDLDTAKDALAHALSGALLGAQPAWLYDFRREGEESVREWEPSLLREVKTPSAQEASTENRKILAQVADDWVDRASKGKLARPVGDARASFAWSSVVDADASRPLRSLLFVGDAGVGKSTEVRHLAYALLAKKREKKNARTPGLYATSAERLLAGMIYLGMWQERVLGLVDELAGERDLLYVDRLLPLLAPQADGASIASLLGGPLAEGEIALVAECTPEELAEARRRDAAFVEHFVPIPMREPRVSALLPSLRAYAARGKKSLHPRALRRATELLATYRRDRSFPGKGFRFLETLEADERAPATIYAPDVERAFARSTGLPLELVSDAQVAGTSVIAERLREGVIGQDAACEAAARAIAPFKAGLGPPDRPLAVLLFAGPTGVGKTELAKRIAGYLFGDTKRLVRVDMSELSTPGSASRLVATGRGVRSLAESVRREPLAVVLLDEVEKAHPEVFDLMLGVLGEGRLTDDTGRFVDFRMTFVVMTSNLGARDRDPVGFDGRTSAADYLRAVREAFRPELLGRIDQVVPFDPLSQASVRRIVDLQLASIARREGLARREVKLVVTDAARERLATLGYEPRYGARPLKRVLETHVVTPVAARLAAEPSLRARTLRVGVEGENAELVLPS
jgi:ATP-dependent Clp protease ATP-binding subunit ClpC